MKVLFVVTAFYPEQAVGSIRVTKFAKYLSQLGDDVSVVSLTPPSWSSCDETLYFDGLESINSIKVDQSNIFKKVLMKARVATIGETSANSSKAMSDNGKIVGQFKYALQFFYTLIKAVDWVFQVRKSVRRNFKGESFDVVFTSYPSLSSPLAGIFIKKLVSASALVVDFRDPVTYGGGWFAFFKKMIQKYIVLKASLVVFPSRGVRDMVIGDRKGGSVTEKQNAVIYNGYDPDDIKSIVSNDHRPLSEKIFRVVYTGALYGGKRDISPFFSAFSEVVQRLALPLDSIQLDYAGSEGEAFRKTANHYGLSACVTDHGRVSRVDSLNLQIDSDLCLLASWNTKSDKGIITGKIFEFFMNRKPVVSIVSGDVPDSELKEIITLANAGYCYEEADKESYSGLVLWLEDFVRHWRDAGDCDHKYSESVDDFSHIKNAEVLHSSIMSVWQ
ncbi:MAG: hypothetical protein V7688_12485 [Alcanivorax jadensis]|uniref:hypothetical protein n=1 Tax=Alcanivorax jadensis TaxID=64988 RepID=UPI0030018764